MSVAYKSAALARFFISHADLELHASFHQCGACRHYLMYGAAEGNGLAVQRMYRERFPDRNQRDCRTFECLHRELRTSGAFYASRHDTGIVRYHRTPAVEERILNTVEDDPSTSSSAVGCALGMSHATVLRTLHEDGMHPYHLQRVQAMTPDDYPPSLNFARWYLQQMAANPNFPADGSLDLNKQIPI